MEAIFFNGAKPFEQIDKSPSTEGPMWTPVKIGQTVLEAMFKDYAILYMYIAKGQEQIFPEDKIWL